MAILGRLLLIAQDTAGNSSSGASISVYKQGAQINGGGQAGPTYTVDHPGGIVAGDVVFAASNTGATRAVNSVTATTVVLASSIGTLSDDDRLLCTTNKPTLYSDAPGTDTLANPLTSDANGLATCWITGGYYDIDFSGGTPNLTRAFDYDVWVGAEKKATNLFDGASAVGYILDTNRTLSTSGALLMSLRNNAAEKWKVGYDGSTTQQGGATIAAGGMTVTAGGLTVSAGTSVVQALTGTTGTFSSDVQMRRFLPKQGTALVAGDFALSAGFGASGSVSITIPSYDTAGCVTISAAGAGTGANPTITLTFKDGGYAANSPRAVLTSRTTVTNLGLNQLTVPFTGNWGTTSVTWQFNGTAAAGEQYQFSWVTVG